MGRFLTVEIAPDFDTLGQMLPASLAADDVPATILAVLEPEAVEVLLADIGDAIVAPLTTYLEELPLRVDRAVSPTARSLPRLHEEAPTF